MQPPKSHCIIEIRVYLYFSLIFFFKFIGASHKKSTKKLQESAKSEIIGTTSEALKCSKTKKSTPRNP